MSDVKTVQLRDLLSVRSCEIITASLQVLEANDQFVPPELPALREAVGPNGERLATYAAAVEDLIETSKDLLNNLDDASETKDDDGTDFKDVAAVWAALLKFGVET